MRASEAREQQESRNRLFHQAIRAYYEPIRKKRQAECKEKSSAECKLLEAYYDSLGEQMITGNVSYFKLNAEVCKHFGGNQNIRKIYDVYTDCPNE